MLTASVSETTDDVRPWPALFALCLGFFMILVDTTIVTVATPAIISDLHSNIEAMKEVMAFLKKESIEHILCLGDLVGYNASPALTSPQSKADPLTTRPAGEVLRERLGKYAAQRARGVDYR